MNHLSKFTIHGELKDGKLTFNRKTYLFQISRMKDGQVEITIEKVRSRRSIQQNRYYWLCLSIIAEHTGYDENELHEIFKRLYLKKPIKFKGREVEITKSTTDLSVGEFVEYMMNVQKDAADLGIMLPDPDEYLYGEPEKETL